MKGEGESVPQSRGFMLDLCNVLCALIPVVILSACAPAIPSESELVLGTVCTITLYERGNSALYQRIFSRFRDIEDKMSANKAGTELDAINKNAGIGPVTVHEDTFDVIAMALRYAEISGGAFDPTVGPLVQLWGIALDNPHVPAQEEIDAVLPLINWRDVVLDPQAHTVFLMRSGMQLDLGGIAKGYAADEAVRIIRAAGIPRAIINLGGNVYAFGIKKDKSLWRIGVQDPLGERDSSFGFVSIQNKTLVTSGVYERFFEQDGEYYHHILSTRDGYPARTGLLSVTIIADRSIDADALSTAVFVMGYEQGQALLESLDTVDALFVFEDGSIRGTDNAIRTFTLTNTLFSVEKER
jgi:thiamine biosynthesis lipoprotein